MAVKCPVCGVGFSDDQLADHLLKDHPSYQPSEAAARRESPHRCIFCGESLATPEALKEHHRTRHAK